MPHLLNLARIVTALTSRVWWKWCCATSRARSQKEMKALIFFSGTVCFLPCKTCNLRPPYCEEAQATLRETTCKCSNQQPQLKSQAPSSIKWLTCEWKCLTWRQPSALRHQISAEAPHTMEEKQPISAVSCQNSWPCKPMCIIKYKNKLSWDGLLYSSGNCTKC